MKIQRRTTGILILTVVFAFCVSPVTWAQNAGQTANPASPASPAPSPSSSQDNAGSNQKDQGQTTSPNSAVSGAKVNPSQPPLMPVTTYPDAAGNPQKEMDASAQPQSSGQSQTQAPTEPQGAATAARVPTAGGAAAKPTGAAIAPAKQRQARSLLIKLGAVAAGAVAAGTVYALSKGTPSTPPGSTSPSAVQKR